MKQDLIIDGRKGARQKNLGNRQRFVDRYKQQVKKAVTENINRRTITDIAGGKDVSVPIGSTDEPSFQLDPATGKRIYVFPGNREYVAGDTIPIPDESGGGGGREGADQGDGMDQFRFVLTRDEFMNIYFEEMELPNLVKTSLGKTNLEITHRAGFSKSGPMTNVDLRRTMRNSMGRRSALHRPSDRDMEEVMDGIEILEAIERRSADEEHMLAVLTMELKRLERVRTVVPFIDEIDVRFRRFEKRPAPVTKAVMFCLMDVSASMHEAKKMLAKRFFLLLYMFLEWEYEEVTIVFIRHTTEAEEVDENSFFTDQRTGGTVVSTALIKACEIIEERFLSGEWNLYVAQASDGDNYSGDTALCVKVLTERLLPFLQYFAYVEIPEVGPYSESGKSNSSLWESYAPIAATHEFVKMKLIYGPGDIYPVLKDLFAKHS